MLHGFKIFALEDFNLVAIVINVKLFLQLFIFEKKPYIDALTSKFNFAILTIVTNMKTIALYE